MKENKNYKNGTELLFYMYLTLESLEQYNVKGRLKQMCNRLKIELESKTIKPIEKIMIEDEEFVNNALKLKSRMVSQIAGMNEADQILFSEFTNRYIQNIELARKKGVSFFDKVL